MLSMYAKGMSTRAISDFIREMYAMEISATEISRITESVMPAVNEWRSRPLEAVYPFVFLDCIIKSDRVAQWSLEPFIISWAYEWMGVKT